jgi:hypothetical protein
MKTGRTSEILFSLPLEGKREQNKFTTADAIKNQKLVNKYLLTKY